VGIVSNQEKPPMKTSIVSLVVVFVVTFTACKSNTSENFLPVLTDIPFYENEHVLLNKEMNLEDFSNLPPTVEMLHDYLQNPADFDEQVLPVLISYGDLTLIQEIDEDRIIIGDQIQNQHFVYNFETSDTTIVAVEGDGPGDVRFMEDIGFFENHLYVGMGTMKIGVFNTDEEVSYEKTINVGTSASSVAPVEQGVLIAGSPTFGSNADSSEFEGLKSISLWSEQGEELHSFGKTYPLKGRFMLSRPFIDMNTLRSIPSKNELMLSYKYFPLLYRYSSDGELLNTYQLNDFSTMVMEYKAEERSVSVPLDDFSEVTDLQFLDEDHLLIYTKTFIKGEEGNENRIKENIPEITETRHQFYVLNVQNNEHSFLGEITGEDTKFKVTPNFILKVGQGDVAQIQREASGG
jgi:hypothetical protein